MSKNIFNLAILHLDADGGHSMPDVPQSLSKNIYWKHKVHLIDFSGLSKQISLNDFFYSLEIPLKLAKHLKVGDTITYIQEEERHEDFLLNYYDYHPKIEKEYCEWKEFLGDNAIGIYVYRRDIQIGINRLNINAFYFDETAVSREEVQKSKLYKKFQTNMI